MQHDFDLLKQKMAELSRRETVDYKEVYRLKLELDKWIEKYYFENM